jgi:hypothetical protein
MFLSFYRQMTERHIKINFRAISGSHGGMMTSFWDIAQCSLAEFDRQLRETALMMEAVSTSEMSVKFYSRRRCNIPDTAEPWFRRLVADLSPRRPKFAPGSVHVGFVVGKVALGHDFIRFYPVNIIPRCLSMLILHLRMNNGPICGGSPEI